MPKTRINKAFMQDWAVISQMSDVRELRALTQAQQSVLVAMCEYLDWKTRWENAPSQDTLSTFAADTRTNIMVGICDELIDCLTPLFAELEAKIDALQTGVTTINNTTNSIIQRQINNTAAAPEAIEETALNAIYGGALALINQMHQNNMKYYAEAEMSAVDNAQEALDIILSLFPKFQDATFEEAFALGNAYFENQVVAYEAGYEDFYLIAACDLYCRINNDNAGVFDFDLWAVWLDGLEVLVPDNAAAKVFARYSPLRQTFLNQIAAFFNQEASLQQYFKDLYIAYYAGTQAPVAVPPECDCVDVWESVLDFTSSSYGFVSYGGYQAGNGGSWINGQGLVAAYGRSANNAYKMVQMALTVTSCNIQFVELEFDLTNGFHSAGAIPGVVFEQVDILRQTTAWFPDGAGQTFAWSGDNDGTTLIGFRIQAGYRTSYAADPGGAVVINRATIRGTGTKPSQLP